MNKALVGIVLGSVICVALGAFIGVRAAFALTAGRPGEHSRSALSVSGTINGNGVTGSSVAVEYVFAKGGMDRCRVPTTLARDPSTGHFTGEVDLDHPNGGMADCPGDLFDGSDVTARVFFGGTLVAGPSPINPVPYARYADQYGTPDCPLEFERIYDGYFTREGVGSDRVLCTRRLISRDPAVEEVVRVGRGASAFWIDRFESSVVGERNGGGSIRFGETGDNFGPDLRDSGYAERPRFAMSAQLGPGGFPARYITWFQRVSKWDFVS